MELVIFGKEMEMNYLTEVLWAKKPKKDQEDKWLPLIVHMSDAAEIARLIWNLWLPSCTKRKIAAGLFKSQAINYHEDDALTCFIFLAALHDLGKATPAFQGRLNNTGFDEQLRQQLTSAGLLLPNIIHPRIARHYWASQVILEKHGYFRELAVIIGGHHGQPPDTSQLEDLVAYENDLGWSKGQDNWSKVQEELIAYALKLADVSEKEALSWKPDIMSQVLLSGLVIMADWIASNEDLFPYIEFGWRITNFAERADSAWDKLALPDCWNPGGTWEQRGQDFYQKRFSFEPRPMQAAILEVLEETSRPGILILEAPMGEGKTEAALAAAEVMAAKTKRGGVFFALPTQASANGLFLRFCNWISKLEDAVAHAVELVHGKANLNELYKEIKEVTEELGYYWVGGEDGEETSEDPIIVHEWFTGRKKGILTEFSIGTIDQVLMAGLKQKHLALRHLGLANKVVILDECHAYDAYMSQYLYKVLNWLGAYEVPVIILSATLPALKRKELIEAYLNRECTPVPDYDPIFEQREVQKPELPFWVNTLDYPIITLSNGPEIQNVRQIKVKGSKRSVNVKLTTLASDEEIITVLADLLSEGGCAGIIVNTVKRAQSIARELSSQFAEEEVHLLHARFISVDRVRKEKELLEKLGPDGKRPYRYIVVGTQIFEQSCDLDFDVMITDICPMDLLIQRIGRLHRHKRERQPKLQQPQCFISGVSESKFDRGAEAIYGKYLLMNTRELLPSYLSLPDNIPGLVQSAYDPKGVSVSAELQEEYMEAKEKHKKYIKQKKVKASHFQISEPSKRAGNLVGWLYTSITDDPSGKRAEATVRDTVDSLEVLVLQKRKDRYYMLPWLDKFKDWEIPADIPPPPELAKALAECSLQLPRELTWEIDKTIKELEMISLRELWVWQQSPWLKNELFLILDEQLSTELCGYHLQYDHKYGLLAGKIEKEDADAGEGIQLTV